jgi:hypothetical protein
VCSQKWVKDLVVPMKTCIEKSVSISPATDGNSSQTAFLCPDWQDVGQPGSSTLLP